MTSISEIRIRINNNAIPQYEVMILSLCNLFLRELNNQQKFSYRYIIIIYDLLNKEEDGKITYTKEHNILEVGRYIKPINLQEDTPPDFQKNILNLLQSSFIHLSDFLNANPKVINSIAENILKSNFKNEWFFRNKLIKSEDKRFYIAILNKFEYHIGFESWLILFDSTKKIVSKNLIFKDSFDSFIIEKLLWKDLKTIMFKFKGPKKEFIYTIDELIEKKVEDIPKKIHKYFK